jgi:predicted RNase H-like HicB family nuclease
LVDADVGQALSPANPIFHLAGEIATRLPKLCENCRVERYATVIHEDPEGGFWAEVPALPGCYSQGETMDELMANVREAIAGVLEVMREQGKRPESNIQILDVAV